jgi:hypothetical protein
MTQFPQKGGLKSWVLAVLDVRALDAKLESKIPLASSANPLKGQIIDIDD